ncbi:MAG: hypothetical protein H7A25_01960 [Leptospiraceae bacterium]|nr:hypothetical protein [Leptospiraceae bacterium]MCP5498641.1 hypothetical protein [Leptospiraceae bacterium]
MKLANLNPEELIKGIRKEVERRKLQNRSHIWFQMSKENWENPGIEIKQEYDISELLSFEDYEFISNLYRSILQRDATEEEILPLLEKLRSGKTHKVLLIYKFTRSEEGRNKGVIIRRLKFFFLSHIVFFIPYLRFPFLFIISLYQLPGLVRRLERIEFEARKRDSLLRDFINEELKKTENFLHQVYTLCSEKEKKN